MGENSILPAIGDKIRASELADGSKIQHITQGVIPSILNTTSVPLASGATFTGEGEVAPADGVSVSCQTDNSGTLYFDFSVDGTNWASFPTNGFVVASGIHEVHSAKAFGRYFRVRLINDSGAQTYLRLHVYFSHHTHLSAPLNQSLGTDSDAIVVRQASQLVDLELGRLGSTTSKYKFGYIRGLGSGVTIGTPATWVSLWSQGGLRTAPTSSFTPYLASSSGSDTAVVMTVIYLDASGHEQTASVTLTGQTGVSLGVTATEVSRAYNSSATDLVGDVSICIADNFSSGVPVTQAQIVAHIPAADQQTQKVAFRVPAGFQAIITEADLSVIRDSGAAGSAACVLQTRETGKVWRTRIPLELSSDGPLSRKVSALVLPPLTDVRVLIRDISDAGTAVSGAISYTLTPS